MKRREVITLLGGAAAWPLAAWAQQGERIRRVGVLMGYAQNDPEARARSSVFLEGLQHAGWENGRNVQIDFRWGGANVDAYDALAKDVVEQQPDVILANTTPVTAALQRQTRTIPIVFVIVSDPVGAGFVASLSRPGGNITGFINFEAPMSGKWLELLKEVAPRVTRAAIMFNPKTAPGGGAYFLPPFEAAASALGVQPQAIGVGAPSEIESAITALGSERSSGLVVFAKDGGLLGYGPDYHDLFRRSASYVDRILRGAKPAELPVQVPIKFELAINQKTAHALGLDVPATLLARADEVIE
jgi:putative tryptophan/tyrosine transport system substrate-binding protein